MESLIINEAKRHEPIVYGTTGSNAAGVEKDFDDVVVAEFSSPGKCCVAKEILPVHVSPMID
jgi:hypothetical protein